MTSSLFERFGALTLPVVAADVSAAGTLTALDPARDILLGLFKQAIISELGAAWTQVATSTALTGKLVVQQALPHEPKPQLARSFKFDFPILAVYRTGQGTFSEHTLTYDKLTQQWGVDYVLGPLSTEDVRILGDVLSAVPKVIAQAIKRRGHPDYASGAVQFCEDSTGALSSIRAISYETGPAVFGPGDDSPTYWATSMRLETTELVDERDGFATNLDGASFAFGVGNASEILPNVIEADTDATVEP